MWLHLLCGRLSPANSQFLTTAHTSEVLLNISRSSFSKWINPKGFLLFSSSSHEGRCVEVHQPASHFLLLLLLPCSAAIAIMDILPFVRFEEAYDPFQETPNVPSRRSSTSWPHLSSDPQSTAAAPKLDFVVYKDCYCLFVELPGLGPEDVQCFVQQEENGYDQLLSVLLIDAGSQSTVVPHLQEGFVSYVLLERSHHRVRRSVVFPLNADTDAAVCSLRQGLLTVVVPKRSSSRALAID